MYVVVVVVTKAVVVGAGCMESLVVGTGVVLVVVVAVEVPVMYL